MDVQASKHQCKQERLRTRWTAPLDKIFADLVVEQIQLGNRPNNVFDKKTWNQIRIAFNKQTDLNFNNHQLRKHLDVLRTRYSALRSGSNQNDFGMEDSTSIGFVLWEDLGAQPRHEPTKIKECPIFGQLCTIFADSGCDGKYAQSSHYEGLDKSPGANPAGLLTSYSESGDPRPKTPSSSLSANPAGLLTSCPESGDPRPKTPGNASSVQNVNKNIGERKRKRSSDLGSRSGQSVIDQELIHTMAKALLEMVEASKLKTVAKPLSDYGFTISNCVKALDEVDGIQDGLYLAALDLFEDPNLRETFLSLKGNKIRCTWLLGKCSVATLSVGR